MLYDKAKMTELVETLRRYHRELVMIAGDGDRNDTSSELGQASERLRQAWSDPNSGEDNTALTAFFETKDKWNTEYHDKGLTALDNIATAVENALHNALNADNAVAVALRG